MLESTGESIMCNAGRKDTYLGNYDFIREIMYRSLLYRYSEITEDGIWLHHAKDMAEGLYQLFVPRFLLHQDRPN
jgi:hypothetical protein